MNKCVWLTRQSTLFLYTQMCTRAFILVVVLLVLMWSSEDALCHRGREETELQLLFSSNLCQSENMDNMKPEEKERGAVVVIGACGNASTQKSILTPAAQIQPGKSASAPPNKDDQREDTWHEQPELHMEPISRARLNDHLAEAQKVAVATKEADKSGASYATEGGCVTVTEFCCEKIFLVQCNATKIFISFIVFENYLQKSHFCQWSNF